LGAWTSSHKGGHHASSHPRPGWGRPHRGVKIRGIHQDRAG
jgi:hypothetical protein